MLRITRTHDRSSPPRGLLAAFVVVVLLPAAVLVWLGLRLLDQDRALEDRRRHELAEAALDRTASLLLRKIDLVQRRLASSSAWPPDDLAPDATLLSGGSGSVLYLPAVRPLPEPPPEPFADADRAEFLNADLPKALKLCTRLSSSNSSAIRAGALLRIARLQQKSGRTALALAAWQRLLPVADVAIASEPAGLAARRARCRALQQAGRLDELREEARLLIDDLHSARWPLSRDLYYLALDQANQWSGGAPPGASPREPQAAALSALWPQRKTVHGALCQSGYTLIWNGDNALIAGPAYRNAHWETPAQLRLACPDEARPPGPARVASLTGLPWTLIGSVDASPLPEFAGRRTSLVSALVSLLVLISAVAWFAWRSVNRELGVARLQSDFVAAVSHEFRTPLTTLRQFNEMLTDEPSLDAATRLRYYTTQGRATERLSRLVETLLDFGRMEAGRRPYLLAPLDAAAIARETAGEFSSELAAGNRRIDCRVPGRVVPIHADREALSRALWNLLDNAAKYSPDHAGIVVDVEVAPGKVGLHVIDHGIGIPAHELERLSQKFFRGESARQRGIPGTGIGLAIVRHIAEAHGGQLEIQSSEGEGSTFTLWLPGKE